MIRLLLILVVGLGLGYTYGYMHGASGDGSIVGSALETVGAHHVANRIQSAAASVTPEEAQRQATIDSIRQARADSIASLTHH